MSPRLFASKRKRSSAISAALFATVVTTQNAAPAVAALMDVNASEVKVKKTASVAHAAPGDSLTFTVTVMTSPGAKFTVVDDLSETVDDVASVPLIEDIHTGTEGKTDRITYSDGVLRVVGQAGASGTFTFSYDVVAADGGDALMVSNACVVAPEVTLEPTAEPTTAPIPDPSPSPVTPTPTPSPEPTPAPTTPPPAQVLELSHTPFEGSQNDVVLASKEVRYLPVAARQVTVLDAQGNCSTVEVRVDAPHVRVPPVNGVDDISGELDNEQALTGADDSPSASDNELASTGTDNSLAALGIGAGALAAAGIGLLATKSNRSER